MMRALSRLRSGLVAMAVLLALPAAVIAQDINGTNGASSTSGTVSSISNSDGTLTLSPNPITGTGTASLNLAHANTWSAAITPSTTAGIVGTTLGDNANAGSDGEYPSSNIPSGSAISLTTSTPANLTSMSLTAGDWDISIQNVFSLTGVTNAIGECGVSQTSATLDQTLGRFGETAVWGTSITASPSCSVPPRRINITTTTTIFDVVNAVFSAGTVTAYGIISARRVR